MSHTPVNLDPNALLSAIFLNLDSQFYKASRDESKLLYNEIAAGDTVPFVQISTKTRGDIECYLELDHSEYTGKLNFGKFRKAMAMMLLAIKERIEAEQPLNMLSSDQGETLFHIPGIVQNDDGTNVMVCSIRQDSPGKMRYRLMFLNPEQYRAELKKVAVKQESQNDK